MKYLAVLLCLGLVMASVRGRGMKRSADSNSSGGDSDSDSATTTTTAAPTTPCPCPFHYVPVCGEDGETYGNECTLNCANIAKASDGACSGSGGGQSFPGK